MVEEGGRRRAGARGSRLDVPRGGAVLRGLAEEEADLLEGLCESVFGGHFPPLGILLCS